MFDLTDELTYWYDDGTCGKSIAEPTGRYGYSSDVGEYGSVRMYAVNTHYHAWGYAEFEGANFESHCGYANDPYAGSHYTNDQYGYAILD